jgi:PAS domain-containing protein
MPHGRAGPAARLREKWPGIELVFVSGAADSARVIRALQLGASDYLVKPYTPEALRLCLSRFHERLALRRRAALAERRYSTLIQNVPLLIFRLREDLSLEFVNHAVQPMLGFSPEEATAGDNWLSSRVRMKDRGRVRKVLAQAFASRYPLTVQCRMVHRRGFDVHGILKTMPRSPEPGASALDGVFMDISDASNWSTRGHGRKVKTIGAISEEVPTKSAIRSCPSAASPGLSPRRPISRNRDLCANPCAGKTPERFRYLNPVAVHTGPWPARAHRRAGALHARLAEPTSPCRPCSSPPPESAPTEILDQSSPSCCTTPPGPDQRRLAQRAHLRHRESVCASFDYELRSCAT